MKKKKKTESEKVKQKSPILIERLRDCLLLSYQKKVKWQKIPFN